ncbi:MAG: glutamate synthase subunit beta [Nannocystaceae bacterium]
MTMERKRPAFLSIRRSGTPRRNASDRVRDYREFVGELSTELIHQQSSRCMDCGVPYCHTGCPLGNMIPDFNDMVHRSRWEQASRRLHATNNFPEVTGRICPAPCEEACTLNLEGAAVNIKAIERQIATQAWSAGLIRPQPAATKSGKSVAIVGSGPAGLACGQQLARAGHDVVIYERDDRIGGLLRYGIPDFKLEKELIDRRLDQIRAEGVVFRTSVEVGVDVELDTLRTQHDAVVLAAGSTRARELEIPGRGLTGIHLAMDYLCQQNRAVAGDVVEDQISAQGRTVVVLGGGDTGADCVSTAIRQGARTVEQIELMPRPPEQRREELPWPYPPMVLRQSAAEEEGGHRQWSIQTRRFIGKGGVQGLEAVRLQWTAQKPDAARLTPQPGEIVAVEADMVFLALGFLGPEADAFVAAGVELTPRGNVEVDDRYMTAIPGVFACGDMRRGQSLVVWAIWEGRQTACAVDAVLCGRTDLPASPHTAPLVPPVFSR